MADPVTIISATIAGFKLAKGLYNWINDDGEAGGPMSLIYQPQDWQQIDRYQHDHQHHHQHQHQHRHQHQHQHQLQHRHQHQFAVNFGRAEIHHNIHISLDKSIVTLAYVVLFYKLMIRMNPYFSGNGFELESGLTMSNLAAQNMASAGINTFLSIVITVYTLVLTFIYLVKDTVLLVATMAYTVVSYLTHLAWSVLSSVATMVYTAGSYLIHLAWSILSSVATMVYITGSYLIHLAWSVLSSVATMVYTAGSYLFWSAISVAMIICRTVLYPIHYVWGTSLDVVDSASIALIPEPTIVESIAPKVIDAAINTSPSFFSKMYTMMLGSVQFVGGVFLSIVTMVYTTITGIIHFIWTAVLSVTMKIYYIVSYPIHFFWNTSPDVANSATIVLIPEPTIVKSIAPEVVDAIISSPSFVSKINTSILGSVQFVGGMLLSIATMVYTVISSVFQFIGGLITGAIMMVYSSGSYLILFVWNTCWRIIDGVSGIGFGTILPWAVAIQFILLCIVWRMYRQERLRNRPKKKMYL